MMLLESSLWPSMQADTSVSKKVWRTTPFDLNQGPKSLDTVALHTGRHSAASALVFKSEVRSIISHKMRVCCLHVALVKAGETDVVKQWQSGV